MAFLFKGKRVPEGVDPARIPPGQTRTAPDRWPVLSFGPEPRTDIATWDFKVFGAVENELTLDYNELRAVPSKDVVADIHCVTGWSRLGDKWTGEPIGEILERVKPLPSAKYVNAHCEHGYTTSVPLSVPESRDSAGRAARSCCTPVLGISAPSRCTWRWSIPESVARGGAWRFAPAAGFTSGLTTACSPSSSKRWAYRTPSSSPLVPRAPRLLKAATSSRRPPRRWRRAFPFSPLPPPPTPPTSSATARPQCCGPTTSVIWWR